MKTPPKILAVDDDPEILEVVKHCLSGANYDVMTLAAGAKVLEVVDAENIDLVILDIGLPDISGLELTRQLKGRPDIGLIILSGQSEPTERVIGPGGCAGSIPTKTAFSSCCSTATRKAPPWTSGTPRPLSYSRPWSRTPIFWPRTGGPAPWTGWGWVTTT